MNNYKIGELVVYVLETGFKMYGKVVDVFDNFVTVAWSVGGESAVPADRLSIESEPAVQNPIIYTSYFGNYRKIPASMEQIAISLMCPKYYSGKRYTAVAPNKNILFAYKENIDILAYAEAYTKMLYEKLNAGEVTAYLKELANGKIPVILCYEKTGSFCHRNILARWLSNNGFPTKEL